MFLAFGSILRLYSTSDPSTYPTYLLYIRAQLVPCSYEYSYRWEYVPYLYKLGTLYLSVIIRQWGT